jgi:hypothetical protein
MIHIVQLNRSGAASPALWVRSSSDVNGHPFATLTSTQVLLEAFGHMLGALILSVDHLERICQPDIFPRVPEPGKRMFSAENAGQGT